MNRKFLCTIGLSFILIGCHLAAAQDVLIGRVVGIADGDTFTLLTRDSTQVKVRVAHIDCPERKQPYSEKAKQFTSDAIFNKMVEVKVLGKDRYRRIIGEVFYGDCLNLGAELLRQGYAWHFKKYSKDGKLQQLEDMARSQKLGLWKDPKPIAPWEWRKL